MMLRKKNCYNKIASKMKGSLHIFTFGFLLALISSPCNAQEDRYTVQYQNLFLGPYRHIYPPANISIPLADCTPNMENPCPLYIALMFSFGGSFTSTGVIPSIQLALDQINNDTSILPGYRLHYLLMDSMCNRAVALRNFFTHLVEGPIKIGVIGSGCSTATEATAEIGPFYNLTQISCLSSSSSLADRTKFRRHFQISASEIILASGFYGIIREYGWQRVGILVEHQNLFTVTMDELRRLLRTYTDIEVFENRFDSEDGIDGLGENPFASEARVYVLSMFPTFARALLCRAHAFRMYYPRALFMVVGWYGEQWWIGNEEEEAELRMQFRDCTVQDRMRVLGYTIAARKAGRLFTDASRVADSGINGTQIEQLYEQYIEASSLDVSFISFYQQCYDATWAMARALHKTYTDITTNPTLAERLAGFNDALTGNTFALHQFTYNNSGLLDVIFNNLHNLSFGGIVGPIRFNSDGLRIVETVDVNQYSPLFDGNGKVTAISLGKIGDIVRDEEAEGNTDLVYITGKSAEVVFPRGIPNDGIPNEVVVGIRVEVSVIFMLLATVGIILSVIGMVLQIMYRKSTVIRLSSPFLNLLIGCGAIVLYASIIVVVLPIVGADFVAIECNLAHWLTAIGYSMCYGTVLAKMTRVYYIFDNPSQRKKKPLQDWMLALGVVVLVAVDVIILAVYNVVEGVRGNLGATRVFNRENPEDKTGTTEIVTRYFVHVCEATSRYYALGVLYGYKMVPQVVALIFAFSIRKIKIKGLEDSKYVAFSVYITSLVTVIVIVIIYTLDHYINIFASIFCTGFFIGTTTILGLVMVPPLYDHFRDPTGTRIFPSTYEDSDSSDVITHSQRPGAPYRLKTGDDTTITTNSDKKTINDMRKKIVLLQNELNKYKEGAPTSPPANTLEVERPIRLSTQQNLDDSEQSLFFQDEPTSGTAITVTEENKE